MVGKIKKNARTDKSIVSIISYVTKTISNNNYNEMGDMEASISLEPRPPWLN